MIHLQKFRVKDDEIIDLKFKLIQPRRLKKKSVFIETKSNPIYLAAWIYCHYKEEHLLNKIDINKYYIVY